MTDPVVLAEVWRGDLPEGRHHGHAVIVDDSGQVVEAWGNPDLVIYPRSSCKMLQALPLVESGAAGRAGLGPEQLALACASHRGGAIHTSRVRAWLSDLGLDEADLRCGSQTPGNQAARHALRAEGTAPDQTHNNCSGKHTGFLTLGAELGGGPDYIDPAHPVQKAVRAAFEEMVQEVSPGFGFDGCSAPNFACTLAGLARAMASLASPDHLSGARREAAEALVSAMAAHPELVADEGAACTELARAMGGRNVVKTGAEGVYIAILPDRRLGIALKVEDGATRASEAAIAALLCRVGVLDRHDPAVLRLAAAVLHNRRGIAVGAVRAAEELF